MDVCKVQSLGAYDLGITSRSEQFTSLDVCLDRKM